MKKPLLLLLIIYSQNLFAQWTNDTTVNTIVRDTAEATVPLMASRHDGKTYISWFEMDAGNYNLHMQLLDENGYYQWAPEGIIVSSWPQNSALFRYDLKVDNEGNAIVAFQDERTGALNIVAYKINGLGNQLWGNDGIVLIDSMSAEGLAPSIGITGQNDVVIAWSADSTSKKWIAAMRISSSGTLEWGIIYRIIDSIGHLKYSRPELFASGSDDIQMMYVEESGSFPGVTSTLYTQRIHPNGGNFWANPIQVSTKTIPYFIFPKPIPDDNGGFYVAFNTSNPVNSFLNDVYVQYVDYNGVLWSATGTEAANSTVNHKSAASGCYVSSSGEFWVLLQVLDNGQGSSGVSVQKFDASGSILLGPDALELIPIDTTYFNPNTINNASDGVILTVTYGTYGIQRIKAIKLDYSGTAVWTNTSVSLCAVYSNKDDLQSGDFIENNLVVVWQDDRNVSGIFAQNITGDGTTGIPLGINENNLEDAISILPNPSSQPKLIFSDMNTSNKIVNITDVQGKIIHSYKIQAGQKSLLLDHLNIIPGIYFISIKSDRSNKTIRWIKN
jgi:hypothetical protein